MNTRHALLVAVPFVIASSLSGAPARAAGADDAKLADYLERSYKCTTAEEWYQLALWCKQNGLTDRVEKNLRRAIRWDPDHALAREQLGFVLYDGKNDAWRKKKWLEGADAEAAKAELRDLAAKAESDKAARDADPWLSQCDAMIANAKSDSYIGKLNIPWDYSSRRDILERNKPYVVLVQDGRDFHYNQIGEVLQQYYKYFETEWAKPFGLPEVEHPLLVVALQDEKSYEDYCAHNHFEFDKVRAAHFEPLTGRVICHGNLLEGAANPFRGVIDQGTFTHEATHQILEYYSFQKTGHLTASNSHWFQEGIAEYIGTVHPIDSTRTGEGHKYFFGRYAGSRADQFHERRLGKKSIFSLGDLLKLRDIGEMHQRAKELDPEETQLMTVLFYAEAWTLIRFFKAYEGPENYSKKFDEYFGAELSGDSGFETFERIFQVKDYTELEKQWLAYVEKNT
jgi:hypothetical protein